MKLLTLIFLATVGIVGTDAACRDSKPYCRQMAKYCGMSSGIRRGCPKTCGVCGGPTRGPPPLPATCGNPAVQMQRVIAGTNAVPHSWPWQILMLRRRIPICGGSIISAKTIVTAAHCVDKYANIPSTFSVRVGVHDRTKSESTTAEYKVKRVIVHRGWNPKYDNNDIALFELEKPIQFNKYVAPVCLPKADPLVGTQCYITGWGGTKYERQSSILQQAAMPVVDNKVCYLKNKAIHDGPITDAMLCSGDGGKSDKSGCHGDSGGPFVCKIGGRWELHGAVSWGSVGCSSTSAYTVHARIHHFRQWIEDNMS